MKTMHRSAVIALFVCCIATQTSSGFPGPPLSLVQRWTQSKLVVLADVTSTGELDGGQQPRGQRAVLSSRVVLKGPAKNPIKPVDVFTIYGLPFPFHFHKGQRLLVFLAFDAELKMYTPVAFEGCLELDKKTFQRYEAALRKLPSILAVRDVAKRQRRLVDWSVDCAVDPITRKDGVIGLWYLRGKHKGTSRDPLTKDHRARLVMAIASEKQPHQHASDVAGLLEPYPSPALDRYLLESLRRSHQPGWRDVTRTAVKQLPGRLGIKLKQSTQKKLDEWRKLHNAVYFDIDAETEPKRHKNAKKRFHILWGSLSREVYNQCNHAMKRKK